MASTAIKASVDLFYKSKIIDEPKPASSNSSDSSDSSESVMERSRQIIAAALNQHKQEADIQRNTNPYQNMARHTAPSYSREKGESSRLVGTLKLSAVFLALTVFAYYGLGYRYGFDRINKPFKDTYHSVKTQLEKIVK